MLHDMLFQDKENHEGYSSSSSDMISFDLSNGDPYPPHLAVALDDDQYVEFHVEELADFPSNAEEEERVSIKKCGFCTYDCSILIFSHILMASDADGSGDEIAEGRGC